MDGISPVKLFPAGKRQKEAREEVRSYALSRGWTVTLDTQQNLILGDPESAKILFTARGKSPGSLLWVEILRTMQPANMVCMVLFSDGSCCYRRRHKSALRCQVVLELDRVGSGDELLLRPCGSLRKNPRISHWLEPCKQTCGEKIIRVKAMSGGSYPNTLRICTKGKQKPEQTNVNILRACLVSLISQRAAEVLLEGENL